MIEQEVEIGLKLDRSQRRRRCCAQQQLTVDEEEAARAQPRPATSVR
jgi:hypothetical protein